MIIEDNKTNLITNSLIEIDEAEGNGKGHYFKSRFIEAGVAHYDELGDILITKETLTKFIDSMVGCPVIINHKDVTDKNVDELRVGVISRVWYEPQDGWFYCEGVITDEQAVDLIKNQGWNVSCSYNFVSDNTPRVHNGKKIDMEFTDGEFLHLAIVENPRYEGANIVVNSTDGQFVTLTKKDGTPYKACLFKSTPNIDSFSRYASHVLAQKAKNPNDKDFWDKCDKILEEIKEEVDYEQNKNRSEQNIDTIKKNLNYANAEVIVTDDNGYKYSIRENRGFGFDKDEAGKIKYNLEKRLSYMNFIIEKDVHAHSQNDNPKYDNEKYMIKAEIKKSADNSKDWDGNEGDWITVNGNHLFIKKGQSKDEAIREYIQRIEQIKKNNEKYQKDKEYYNKKQEEKLTKFKKEYPIGTKFIEKYFGEDREHSIQSVKLDNIDKAIIIIDENGKEHHALARDITLTKEKSDLKKDKNIERNKSLLKTDLTHMLKDIDRSADYRFEDSTQKLQVNDFGLWEKSEDGELRPTKETKQKVEQIKDTFKKRFNLDLDSTWSEKKLYTFSIKNKTNNNIGDIMMTVLNDLKDFITNVVSNEKDDEMKVKNEDKRKLIDEVGGILKGKVDEEVWRTIIGKLEKIAYKPSEDDKADNEIVEEKEEDKKVTENEDEEKEEKFEEEKEIANKKAKNEDKEDKTENKCGKAKNSIEQTKEILFGGIAKEEKEYLTREERIELGNEY